jgi:hypothetical protein
MQAVFNGLASASEYNKNNIPIIAERLTPGAIRL